MLPALLNFFFFLVPVLVVNVWFQKISIPPPWKVIGNSEGEGGKGS